MEKIYKIEITDYYDGDVTSESEKFFNNAKTTFEYIEKLLDGREISTKAGDLYRLYTHNKISVEHDKYYLTEIQIREIEVL